MAETGTPGPQPGALNSYKSWLPAVADLRQPPEWSQAQLPQPAGAGSAPSRRFTLAEATEALRANLFTFRGRAAKSEFWWCELALYAVALPLLSGLDLLLGRMPPVLLVLILIVQLAVAGLVTWIGIALAARRVHDTGSSAWYLVLALIPLLGAFLLLAVLMGAGDDEPNKYGTPRRPARDRPTGPGLALAVGAGLAVGLAFLASGTTSAPSEGNPAGVPDLAGLVGSCWSDDELGKVTRVSCDDAGAIYAVTSVESDPTQCTDDVIRTEDDVYLCIKGRQS